MHWFGCDSVLHDELYVWQGHGGRLEACNEDHRHGCDARKRRSKNEADVAIGELSHKGL